MGSRVLPLQRPGRSKQTYATPLDFIEAVERRFEPIAFDLAANSRNAKAARYFTMRDNALSKPWTLLRGLLWLNPPFAHLAPWVAKCEDEAGRRARIVLLVPAAVGSNWFARHVWRKATTLFLSPRLTFDGERTPYPKDLMLCVYDRRFPATADVWRWDQ